jgi:hypothetical protein
VCRRPAKRRRARGQAWEVWVNPVSMALLVLQIGGSPSNAATGFPPATERTSTSESATEDLADTWRLGISGGCNASRLGALGEAQPAEPGTLWGPWGGVLAERRLASSVGIELSICLEEKGGEWRTISSGKGRPHSAGAYQRSLRLTYLTAAARLRRHVPRAPIPASVHVGMAGSWLRSGVGTTRSRADGRVLERTVGGGALSLRRGDISFDMGARLGGARAGRAPFLEAAYFLGVVAVYHGSAIPEDDAFHLTNRGWRVGAGLLF